MNKPFAEPKMLASSILVLLLTAAALIPARALAGPPEGGEGGGTPLVVTPEVVAFPKTTIGYQSQNQEVRILNKGEDAVIDKISFDGGDGSFHLDSNSCGYLGVGQECSLWISFSPSSEGEKEAKAEIVFKGERPAEVFRVGGTAVPPKLTFAPESHDFGLRQVNRESSSTIFQIVNDGEAGVAVGNFEVDGSGANAFGVGNSDCGAYWRLEPGQACSVEIWFNPYERRGYEAELRTNVSGTSFSAGLSGQGGAAVIESPQNPAVFAPATVGTKGEIRTITLVNSGDMPASFFISVIAGGDAGSFELLDENCSAAPLDPAATCSAHVQFAPRGPGQKAARLAFFGDGSDGMMVFLQGEGVEAAATLLPGSHDFGLQTAGAKSAAHAFVVRNDGATALGLDRVEIVGADLDQFALSGDDCSGTELAPGEECLVRVRFAPDSAGAKVATLRVRGDAGALSSSLSGSGQEAPAPAGPEQPAAVAKPGGDSASAAASGEGQNSAHRQKRRFIRGQSIRARGGQPLRRGELRAKAARH